MRQEWESVRLPDKCYGDWMCNTGPGKLHRIEGTLKGPQYVDILENIFLQQAMERFGCEATIKCFHDNSPSTLSESFVNGLKSARKSS